MHNTVFTLLKKAQEGDKTSTLEIINKFNPIIKKYSRKLNYDGSDTDLIIALIEIIKSIPISINPSLQQEECLVGYIASSLRYKYIKLSKKYNNLYRKELELNEHTLNEESISDIETNITLSMILDKLPSLQKEVLTGIFIKGFSASLLAKNLHTSRQAVNQAKNRGLKNLKELFSQIG